MCVKMSYQLTQMYSLAYKYKCDGFKSTISYCAAVFSQITIAQDELTFLAPQVFLVVITVSGVSTPLHSIHPSPISLFTPKPTKPFTITHLTFYSKAHKAIYHQRSHLITYTGMYATVWTVFMQCKQRKQCNSKKFKWWKQWTQCKQWKHFV